MLYSIRSIAKVLYEPFAVLVAFSLLYLVACQCRRRNKYSIIAVGAVCFTLLWRIGLHIRTTRYFETIILPCIAIAAFLLSSRVLPQKYMYIFLLVFCLILGGKGINVNRFSLLHAESCRSINRPAHSEYSGEFVCCSEDDFLRTKSFIHNSEKIVKSFPEIPFKEYSLDQTLKYIVSYYPFYSDISKTVLLRWDCEGVPQYSKGIGHYTVNLVEDIQVTKNKTKRLLKFNCYPASFQEPQKILFDYKFEPVDKKDNKPGYAKDFLNMGIPFYQKNIFYPWEVSFHFPARTPESYFEAEVTTKDSLLISGEGSLRVKNPEPLYVMTPRFPVQDLVASCKLRSSNNININFHVYLYHPEKGWNGGINIAKRYLPKSETITVDHIMIYKDLIPDDIETFRVVIEVPPHEELIIDDFKGLTY